MPSRRRTAKVTPAKLAKRMSRRWRAVLLARQGRDSWDGSRRLTRQLQKLPPAVQFELDDVQRNRIILEELG